MGRMWVAALALLAAGCGAGGGDEKKADAPPALLPAGTWTVTSEVTGFRSLDKNPPALKAKVGDKETATICAPKAAPEPPAALFAGTGYQCAYKSAFIKDGLLNATLDCRRAGIEGSILMTVQGSYTAKGFDGTADTTAYLPGPGDFGMNRKISGTVKPGACTPSPAGGGGGNAAGGAEDTD